MPSPSDQRPTDQLFRPSLTGWYAAWKARREAADSEHPAARPAPQPEPGPLARWLTGETGMQDR
jgi:hypothetical protein